jgi:hypothetical protein
MAPRERWDDDDQGDADYADAAVTKSVAVAPNWEDVATRPARIFDSRSKR